MSDFDLINFMMIGDVDRGAKNQERLGDLRDRAAYIAKKTGQDPQSWYEFKENSPQEKPNTIRNMMVYGAGGLGLGAIAGLVFLSAPAILPLALTGTFLGGILGVFSDTENKHRDKLVQKYEDYLNGVESMGMQQGRAPTQDISHKSTHAADLTAQQQTKTPLVTR